MTEKKPNEPPFQGGAQPVPQRPEEVPGMGRWAIQTIVLIVAALAVVAAIMWVLVPFGG